jgi:hypothetical protein
MNRRGFLVAGASLLMAPAIVRASAIMPVSVLPQMTEYKIRVFYQTANGIRVFHDKITTAFRGARAAQYISKKMEKLWAESMAANGCTLIMGCSVPGTDIGCITYQPHNFWGAFYNLKDNSILAPDVEEPNRTATFFTPDRSA